MLALLLVGALGLESHATALTWRVHALLSGGDGPTVVASGARDGSWARGALTITLAADDDAVDSGIASITYSLDGVSHTVAADTARIDVPALDGAHTITYSATDNAGTTGAAGSLAVHVDTTGPRTATKPARGATGEALALRYRITDAGCAVAQEVTAVIKDGRDVVKRISLGARKTGVWQRTRWTPSEPGVYQVVVTAEDRAGNRETARAASGIVVEWPVRSTIGHSRQGRRITVARFGSGSHRLLIVGGVHANETGVSVARKLIAYLTAHPEAAPEGWRIDVIPCLSPDGLAHGTRGNANDVDLNRNFPSSSWRRVLQSGDPSSGCGLSGGRRAGSEPETKALMAYLRQGFDVELSLHCDAGILDCHGPGGVALGKRMAALCDLPVGRLSYESKMTGTLEQYVAQEYGIPAITVELRDAELRDGLRRALLAACR